MGEIKRYTLGASCLGYDVAGRLVFYEDHLADKKAALAAQAEEHSEEMGRLNDAHASSLLGHLSRLESIAEQHAQELAEARGEGEAATGCPLAEVRAELDQVRGGLAVANQKLHRIAGIACEVNPHA